MKKLIYLIVLIVVLGLIVVGCTNSVVPPAEQGELDNLEMISVSKSVIPVVIDGDVTLDEWGTYHLGTSVTSWGGGMSVDVYGYADDTYLYVAYEADMSQPGWSVAAGMQISANLDYWTPSTTVWPDPGYTHISVFGDGFAQTDGSSWNWPDGWGNTDPSVFTSRGIEYYVGISGYPSLYPYPNTAEIKIPLSLLTYADTDDIIGLGGQYWQYDKATPFLVALPQPTHGHWVNNQRVLLYPVPNCDSAVVNTDAESQGEVLFNDPMGKVTLVIQGNVEGLTPKHEYAVWVRNLSGYTGPYLGEHTLLGYYKLETFTTNVKGKGKFHINILADDLPTGTYEIQLAINDPDVGGKNGCTVLATEAPPNWVTVTIKGQE